jgi:sugar/nucleoside kinase (ribokinase family)
MKGTPQMEPFDVLVIGRGCLDVIAVVERFPAENSKVPLEFRLTEGGGQGATAACCIRRLGGRVVYVGKVGDDPEGRFCLQRLSAFGVDTRRVEAVPGGRTPTAYIFVTRTTGERTIIYERNRLPKITLDVTLRDLIDRAPVLLLDPETTYLANDLLRLKRLESTVVYDAERWREGMSDMMALADYFIPSADFLSAEQLQKAGLRFSQRLLALKKSIRGKLVVTDGAGGALYIHNHTLYRVPPPDLTAVDTIGAGDNFHAAFALALARNFSLRQAVPLAVAVASLSCRDYGGRNAIPTWEEAAAVADRLQSQRLSVGPTDGI